MKKVFLLLSVCASLAACSSNSETASTTTKTSKSADADLPVNMPPPASAAPEKQSDALAQDSTTATNVSAVANQLQADTNSTKIGTSPVGSPSGGKGAKLVAAADCGSCHREREKLLGPAYTAVAEKYPATPANITMLAKKVIKGGMGHWGDIAMTPHPALSESDSKEMIRYVLSLK